MVEEVRGAGQVEMVAAVVGVEEEVRGEVGELGGGGHRWEAGSRRSQPAVAHMSTISARNHVNLSFGARLCIILQKGNKRYCQHGTPNERSSHSRWCSAASH
jgi:hypothetical protein